MGQWTTQMEWCKGGKDGDVAIWACVILFCMLQDGPTSATSCPGFLRPDHASQ